MGTFLPDTGILLLCFVLVAYCGAVALELYVSALLSWLLFLFCFVLFLRFYLFIFREGNVNVWLPLVRPLLGTWPATQACALTRNPTSDPLVRRPALNPLSHTSQGS